MFDEFWIFDKLRQITRFQKYLSKLKTTNHSSLIYEDYTCLHVLFLSRKLVDIECNMWIGKLYRTRRFLWAQFPGGVQETRCIMQKARG